MSIKVVGSNLVHQVPVKSTDSGGGGGSVTVDSELSLVSENPVQNKVITQALNAVGEDIENTVTDWLENNITQETGYVLDDTLTVSGAAADAKATGDAIGEIQNTINNDLLPSAELIQKNVVLSNINTVENKTINVAETGYVSLLQLDQVSASKDDKFIIAVKISTAHSNDYKFTVRLRKFTSDGGTGTYYFPDTIDMTSHFICAIVATSSDVVSVLPQLRYAYTGNEAANFSETFTIEYVYIYKNDIYLFNDLALTKAESIEGLLSAGLTATYLANNVIPFFLGLRSYGKYPNVDTTAQTLTIYSKTVIYAIDGTEVFATESDIVVPLAPSIQISRLIFDIQTSSFSCVNTTVDRTNPRYLSLGLIQNQNGLGWIGIPHTINGFNPYVKSDNPMWDLPSTWSNKVQTIQEAQGKTFTFAIQTDTHYALNENDIYGYNLKSLTNNVGMDFVANLGDIIEGYANETTDSPENMRAAMTQIMRRYVTGISCPLLVAMGNHDTNKQWADAFDGTPFTFDEVWAREFKPAFNTNPHVETETGLMYYYTDFADVRVIVLNTQDGANGGFGIGSTQIDWLTNTALNTSKAVLVLSHVPLVDGWSVSSNYVSSYANAVTAIKAFQTNGGTVIGCMSGHTHTQETKTVDGILYVTFRNGGAVAEVVMVDIDNKSISTIPVGFTGEGNRSFTFV